VRKRLRRLVASVLRIAAVTAALVPATVASNNWGPVRYSDSGPEAMLAHVFHLIEKHRLDFALAQTDALIDAYPTFRLAYLIRGDLLLARSGHLAGFGAAPDAPAERIEGLRDEAMARLAAYHHKPPTDRLPRYLLQMDASQEYALVVDARRSRLYVYRNDNGMPRLAADYYVSQGKRGVDKLREGDKKTPVGVYHVTSSVPRDKLSDFYGSGAFPISYPNEWDRLQGRDGHGIWLHGTPSDTFSRPPKASDGCVVLSNRDLTELGKTVQVGLTPVIISDDVEWLSPTEWQRERNALAQAVDAWRRDWESRNAERFLAHYSRRFKSDAAGYEADFEGFAARKRAINDGKRWVKVELRNLSMFRNPGAGDVVVVTFEQDYRSDNLNDSMKKRQYWSREDGVWRIVYEGAA
jgi:murein L,D-transpeptidase YafK